MRMVKAFKDLDFGVEVLFELLVQLCKSNRFYGYESTS